MEDEVEDFCQSDLDKWLGVNSNRSLLSLANWNYPYKLSEISSSNPGIVPEALPILEAINIKRRRKNRWDMIQ